MRDRKRKTDINKEKKEKEKERGRDRHVNTDREREREREWMTYIQNRKFQVNKESKQKNERDKETKIIWGADLCLLKIALYILTEIYLWTINIVAILIGGLPFHTDNF